MIRKMLMTAVAAVAMLAVSAGAAFAYYGGWYYNDVPGEWEDLRLGDNSDGLYLHLSGTRDWCVKRGVPYSKVRNLLSRNDTEITWWVDADCGSIARICVQADWGEVACSSYWVDGWRDWY